MDKNLPYLALAYTAWWAIITGYAVHLSMQLRKVRNEVEDLKGRLGPPRI